MECCRCGKGAEISTRAGGFCKGCFRRRIEKRVRAHIRKGRLFRVSDRVYCEDSVTRTLIERIFKGAPLKIADSARDALVLSQRTMDDENALAMKAIFDGERIPASSRSVLSCLTDEEVERYAELVGVEFTPSERDAAVEQFLATMRERYPDTPYSLKRSIDTYRQIYENVSAE